MEIVNQKLTELKKKANHLPQSPGVYIMKNKDNIIIYIGKAKALKNRVTQYFGSGNQHTQKVRKMVESVYDFEYIICDSEFEALILENSLIKQNQPKYNILLKDDKGYHYIKISNEKWRKISTAKSVEKGAEYIGPYNSGYIVNQTVEQVRKIFKLPDCNRNFDKFTKPCLNYHIGLCSAPCAKKIDLCEYNKNLNAAIDFIKNDSSIDIVIKKLNEQMLEASGKMDFEAAAKLRDRISAIKKINERQKVVMTSQKSQDVIAAAFVGERACVEVLIFRNNRLSDKVHYIIDGYSDKDELYPQFLQSYYQDKADLPSRIVMDYAFSEHALIEKWLESKANKKVEIIIPIRGEQKKLVDMCLNNAADNLSASVERSGHEMSALNELATLLNLEQVPRYIESYDISNLQGSENVAGMIVFKDGRPYKSAYRRFKIKGFIGQNDFRSMAEVIERRLNEYLKGEDEAFSVLPDLILLDGGKGQISAVKPIIERFGLDIALFGMVKDSKHRTRAISDAGGDIIVKANRGAFSLITGIQNEVHRFAIGYHKSRRTKAMLSSRLLEIEGVGKKNADALIKHFLTVEKLSKATLKELEAVEGIGPQRAKQIFEYFNKKD